MLKSYVAELIATNPNIIVELFTIRIDNNKEVFDCLYVCFGVIKYGFNRSCRKFIYINGSFFSVHMKEKY